MKTQLDNIVFKYLDNQDFIITGNDTNLFFVKLDSDKYAQIRFDKKDGWCFIKYSLIDEISSFFSLEKSDSEKIIGRWVENTLQTKVTNTDMHIYCYTSRVENTLQTKVTNTFPLPLPPRQSVENTLQTKVTN